MREAALKKTLLFALSVFLIALRPAAAGALTLSWFAEGAFGLRTENDTTRKDAYNLMEGRFQLKGSHSPRALDEWSGELIGKAEVLADGYDESIRFTIREAALSITPVNAVDIKVGRQVLTWGTGDYIFVNDLFPKDYVSFFTGRDDEYLKVPSNALRVSVFAPVASLDMAVMPVMEPNNSVTGTRLSFYDGTRGAITGDEANRVFVEPAKTIENVELAARAYRTFGSFEGALYWFRGFYNEPRGIIDAATEQFFYPRLSVYGFSLRGPLLGGIGSFEAGYYDSEEDRSGRDAMVENSSMKYLAGYTRDLGGDLNIGGQYSVEQMLDYNSYRASLGAGEPARDELRHLVTLRVMKLMKAQTIEAVFFAFYSPSDCDAYLRPSIGYKITDSMKVTAGANIFIGALGHTQFGQFERNDNIYARVRYSF